MTALTNSTALLMAAYQQHIEQFGIKNSYYNPKTGLTHIGNIKVDLQDGKLSIEGDGSGIFRCDLV